MTIRYRSKHWQTDRQNKTEKKNKNLKNKQTEEKNKKTNRRRAREAQTDRHTHPASQTQSHETRKERVVQAIFPEYQLTPGSSATRPTFSFALTYYIIIPVPSNYPHSSNWRKEKPGMYIKVSCDCPRERKRLPES